MSFYSSEDPLDVDKADIDRCVSPGVQRHSADDLVDAWKKYRLLEDLHFIDFTGESQLFDNEDPALRFLPEFETRATKAMSAGCGYTDTLLAFKLLEKCQILEEPEVIDFLMTLPEKITEKICSSPSSVSPGSLFDATKSFVTRLISSKDRRCLASSGQKNLQKEEIKIISPGVKLEIKDNQIEDDILKEDDILRKDELSSGRRRLAGNVEVFIPSRKPRLKKKDRCYACNKCHFAANTRPSLEKHKLASHFNFKCEECHFTTTEEKLLIRHLKASHGQTKFKCQSCEKLLPSWNTILRHRKIQHEEGLTDHDLHVCETCGHVASSKAVLRQHVSRAHRKNLLAPCSQCNYVGRDKTELRLHILTRHQGVTFSCDQCDFKGPSPKSVKRHKDMYHDLIRYQCDKCHHVASDRKGLKLHMQSKHDGVRYSCDICNLKLVTPGSLKRHKESVHLGLKFPCDKCGFLATQRGQLIHHIKNKHRDN